MSVLCRGGFVLIMLLVFLTGACMAEETPSYIAYIQGGKSNVSSDSDGMSTITIQNVVPFFYFADKGESNLVPLTRMTRDSFPLNAAVVFSGSDGESTSLLNVSNMSWSDDDASMVIFAKPLQYYEGDGLKAFNENVKEAGDAGITGAITTGIYIEYIDKKPVNSDVHIEVCPPYCGPV